MPNARRETYEEFIRLLEAGAYWRRITQKAVAVKLRNEVVQLVQKYHCKTPAGAVLIDRGYAHSFLTNLEALSVAVWGCDHYEYAPYRGSLDNRPLIEIDGRSYYAYPGTRINQAGFAECLIEITDGGFYVGRDCLLSGEPAAESLHKTREHILRLPLEVEFVEIMLVTPRDWLGNTSPYS